MTWHPVLDAPTRSGAEGSALDYPSDSERFFVEELPLYEASGEGEHLYLEIEKRDMDTPRLLARLAACLELDAGELGWAGRKDRWAVSRQRISVPRRAEARLQALASEPFQVLSVRAHRNKLRVGHLAGNRFRLILAGEADAALLAARLERLGAEGLPNYFGHQRFGSGGDNHERGLSLLRSGRRARSAGARFLLSAYQSALFNRVLAERIESFGRLMAGDLAWLHDRGAVFRVTDPAAEQPRADALEISPSGPLPGRRMSRPSDDAGRLEEALLSAGGWDERWQRALTGGRRPLRVPVGELSWRDLPGGFVLCFSLPPGAYASVLLAELGVRPGTHGPGEEE